MSDTLALFIDDFACTAALRPDSASQASEQPSPDLPQQAPTRPYRLLMFSSRVLLGRSRDKAPWDTAVVSGLVESTEALLKRAEGASPEFSFKEFGLWEALDFAEDALPAYLAALITASLRAAKEEGKVVTNVCLALTMQFVNSQDQEQEKKKAHQKNEQKQQQSKCDKALEKLATVLPAALRVSSPFDALSLVAEFTKKANPPLANHLALAWWRRGFTTGFFTAMDGAQNMTRAWTGLPVLADAQKLQDPRCEVMVNSRLAGHSTHARRSQAFDDLLLRVAEAMAGPAYCQTITNSPAVIDMQSLIWAGSALLDQRWLDGLVPDPDPQGNGGAIAPDPAHRIAHSLSSGAANVARCVNRNAPWIAVTAVLDQLFLQKFVPCAGQGLHDHPAPIQQVALRQDGASVAAGVKLGGTEVQIHGLPGDAAGGQVTVECRAQSDGSCIVAAHLGERLLRMTAAQADSLESLGDGRYRLIHNQEDFALRAALKRLMKEGLQVFAPNSNLKYREINV